MNMDKPESARYKITEALEIDLLLENIFKYLKLKDIAICRIINRHWCSVATPLMKEMISQFTLNFAQSDITKYCDYVSTSGSDCVKYSNFKFYQPPIESEFLEKCGEHVTSLTFQYIYRNSLESLTQILTQTPNLAKFEIVRLSLDYRSTPTILQDNVPWDKLVMQIRTISITAFDTSEELGQEFLLRLFRACPNLKEAITGANNASFLHQLLFTERAANLSHLSLGHVDGQILEILCTNKDQFHLKFLKIGQLLAVEGKLLEFLQVQANSLESFIVCELWSDFPHTNGITFPERMPNLKLLRIGLKRWDAPYWEALMAPLNIPRQLPALQKLLISGCGKHQFFDIHIRKLGSGGALRVGIGTSGGGLLPPDVQKLGRLFPNLTELSVGYQSGHVLREIWTAFPGLESCTLSVGLDKICNIDTTGFLKLDEILTGFSKKEMKRAKKMCRDVGKPRFESITNLKNLRELTLHYGPFRNRPPGRRLSDDCVTDIGAFYALQKLESLKYLAIRGHNISQRVVDELCRVRELHQDTSCSHLRLTSHPRSRYDSPHPMCTEDDVNYVRT
ncbi:uncharacterized protein LOC118437086 [Folsomia candida]|uniref:F-box domain-containing protein n=1 Tax=Folsomia candida TaxID=158441 RepID=A0A226DW63_FOLCA|nr:uncharacterized protein LOC118437086 [Folsomia candida]OXA48931.1 hypothetical protein Fcan01_16551 [Folsomia candida]